jgi:glycosyltransferase involved in cell wall biosynthesis
LTGALNRVLIFIPEDYAAGGLQRSAVALHDCLAEKGYRATIHCTRLMQGGFAENHSFISAVAPVSRSRLVTWTSYLRGMRKLLRQERPVAAIGLGLVPSAALPLAAVGLRIPLIGSERAFPPAVPVGPIFAGLRKLMFPRLDAVVCQTAVIADWFEHALGIPAECLAVIPNVVRPPNRDWKSNGFEAVSPDGPKTFVAVGRLDPQKGFDLALRTFALVVKERPQARLLIVGEGPSQEELLALRAQLNLTDHVEFRAPRDGLQEIWGEAFALLFTSRYEGFPNVLAEAMAHGVPAAAFDCPTGPTDLIDDGRNGFLVKLGDIEALSKRVVYLIDNPAMRDDFGAEAMDVADRFSPEKIADQWAALLDTVT